jgi:cell division septum initiation protein DivIVA
MSRAFFVVTDAILSLAMRIRPEELTVSALPRSPLPGGIKTDAAAQLLQRAARDYRDAVAEIRRLDQIVEKQTRRIEELELQVASLEADVTARKNPDKLGRTLLEAAQRTARERREDARREAELLLKKAARRAETIELTARRQLENGLAELGELQAFRDELSHGLRSTLEAIVALDVDGSASEIRHLTPDRRR